ncbi:hypothetical protein FEM48_Zijuj12G0142000 [Ziziphus jujuba var. spinosa]|nr:hypothetical protein FEM48_Zijuj12G0142000 [Ziziphus jujuba var. spinosa]
MEVDLTTGTQMAYVVPDLMMTINDFANHVEISVQTHGYEDWQGGESNILISRMVIGRLTNTSFTNFEYNVQNVADYLASNGVLALPGTKYSTADLQGRRWVLQPSRRQGTHNPTQVITNSLLDGGVSLSFRGYSATAERPPPPVDSQDLPAIPDDALEEQFLAVWTFEEPPHYDTSEEEEDIPDRIWEPCPPEGIWEENRSGNYPKAF